MPQDPQRPPQEPETPSAVHDEGARRNIGLWAGLGCLGVIVLSCCLLSYWAQAFGYTWVLNQGDEVRSRASRFVLSGALQAIRSTCIEGTTREDVDRWFHPDVPRASRDVLCGLDDVTIQQIGSAEQVSANSLVVSGESDLAEQFEMDPALCYRYTAETLGLVGCFQADDTADAIPFKIIEVAKL